MILPGGIAGYPLNKGATPTGPDPWSSRWMHRQHMRAGSCIVNRAGPGISNERSLGWDEGLSIY